MPQAIGAAIIAAGQWVSGTYAATVAAEGAGALTFADTTILGVNTATFIGTVAINAVAFSAQLAMASQVTPQSQKVNVRNPVQARRSGYGIVKVGGSVFFLRRSTITGDGILHLGVALLSREIDGVIDRYLYDQITRVNDVGNAPVGFTGATGACFPALAEIDKPEAVRVIITIQDVNYAVSAPVVTASYNVGPTAYTLEAISVGVSGGSIVSIVFPYTVDGEKPIASGVTFAVTNTGGGSGASFTAVANGSGTWDGGFSPNGVTINSGGSAYPDTVGGYGAYFRPRPNGAGNWDGGCSPKNIAVDAFGTGYNPSSTVVKAHYPLGAAQITLSAISSTIGSSGSSAASSANGQVIYPGVWLDNNRVTILTYLGEALQDADPLLMAAFPGAWTENHRLNGIAYSSLKLNGVALNDFAAVYKAGIPSYTAVIRAAKVWDPRISGCIADDSSTWVWTDNAALVIMDYLWHPDGMRLPRALIELAIDRWIAVADCSDELVPLLNGGTEKRYRLAGTYEFTEQPKNVLARMLLAIDGRLKLRADGAIVLDIGEFCDPVVTITDADIISYDMRRGPSKIDLKNEIRATYTAPGLIYEQQEADPWRNEASILVDGLQSVSMNLDWSPSHSQTRRRMKVEAIRQNPTWQGTVVTNAKGAELLGLRYGTFQITDLLIDEPFYLQKSSIDLLNGVCTFEISSFPANAYAFDPTTEEGISPENNSPGDHGVVVPDGTTQVVITVDGAGGGGYEDDGGGGSRAIKTIGIDPADWGTVILYHVGRAGKGDATYGVPPYWTMGQTSSTVNEDGEGSTVTGTLVAGAINIVAGGGHKGTTSPGAGGIATGGDVNIPGGFDGVGMASGGAPNIDAPDGFPGGGGWRLTDGANGSVTFQWSYGAVGHSVFSANLTLSTSVPTITVSSPSLAPTSTNLRLTTSVPSVV